MILLFLMSALTAQALELNTDSFHFCSRKTAKGVLIRSLRIHQVENKCAVFYTDKGIDERIASGRWLSFCENKAKQVIENLQKGAWTCKKQSSVVFFYPFF